MIIYITIKISSRKEPSNYRLVFFPSSFPSFSSSSPLQKEKSQKSNNYFAFQLFSSQIFFKERTRTRTYTHREGGGGEGGRGRKGRKFISTRIVEFHPWEIWSCITHKIPYIRQAVTGNSISTCNEVPLFDSAYFRIFQTFVHVPLLRPPPPPPA